MSVNLSVEENRWIANDTESGPRTKQRPVVVLIAPAGSYRTADFVEAAKGLRVDLVVGTDGSPPMGEVGPSRSVAIDFDRIEWSAARVAGLRPTPDAVIAADDRGVVIAALASNLLSLPTNPVSAVAATRDKGQMRGLLAAGAVAQPEFRSASAGDVAGAAASIGYPCVVKPRSLSASQGVIRVDGELEAESAEVRIREILSCTTFKPDEALLVEEFVAGPEVAIEGILIDGQLQVLAILDKPDPLEGPYFEETMFITPSRFDGTVQRAIAELVQSGTRALGLVSGPIHAEVRLAATGPVLIEVAARSIGGLCGRSLSFGLLGESLEMLILRSALGLPGSGTSAAVAASGVLMLPIPREGALESIEGVDAALAVNGVTQFAQTIHDGKEVVPLPEGDRYLGFLFAEGLSPGAVEDSLRLAHSKLEIKIV